MFVSLLQAETDRDNLPAIGFKLLNKRGNRIRNVYTGEQVLGGAYSHSSEVRGGGGASTRVAVGPSRLNCCVGISSLVLGFFLGPHVPLLGSEVTSLCPAGVWTGHRGGVLAPWRVHAVRVDVQGGRAVWPRHGPAQVRREGVLGQAVAGSRRHTARDVGGDPAHGSRNIVFVRSSGVLQLCVITFSSLFMVFLYFPCCASCLHW